MASSLRWPLPLNDAKDKQFKIANDLLLMLVIPVNQKKLWSAELTHEKGYRMLNRKLIKHVKFLESSKK